MPFGFAAAIFSGAGLAAATAAITVVGSLEVVAAVGAVLSVVGAVTHDKVLSEVGMGLGIVGGVGALAASAGLLGADAASGASLFGTDTAASVSTDAAAGDTGAASLLDSTGTAGADVGATTAATVSGGDTTDIVNSLGGITSSTPTDAIANDMGVATGNAGSIVSNPDTVLSGSLVGGGAPSDAAAGVTGAAPTAASALPGTPGGVAVAQPGNAALVAPPSTASIAAPTAPAVAAPAAPGTSTTDLAQILASNQKSSLTSSAIMGALQVGGAFLTGATNPLTPAQIAQAQAQANANNAAAGLTNLQVSNLSQPIPVASSKGSNASGLINTVAA